MADSEHAKQASPGARAPAAVPSAASMLTPEQEMVLRAAGSFVDQMPPPARRGLTTAAKRTSELLATAFTVDQAAVRLGVTSRGIRNRLADRTLLSMKVRNRHRLPAFQFAVDSELCGWAQVAPAFPTTAAPTSMVWFMQTSHPDLSLDGRAVSLASWLAAGKDPGRVVDMITTAFEFHAS
ncbi:hypothetical protein [Gordonia malaquae]|uniref:hypothetical protein n=1 Tax=Gordonia malaquae TaxID=410332 RepID=UPI0030FE3849